VEHAHGLARTHRAFTKLHVARSEIGLTALGNELDEAVRQLTERKRGAKLELGGVDTVAALPKKLEAD
jgi:hypothetical protein